jgi:phosphohistidine phosphatase
LPAPRLANRHTTPVAVRIPRQSGLSRKIIAFPLGGSEERLRGGVKWLVQIYLLRHGIAENGAPGRPDSERALTDAGREKLRRVLERARDAGVRPSLILSSPYRRAIETADVAVEVLGYRGKVVTTRALVPEASPFDTWEEIRERPEESAILLASHEPLMSSLAAFLLASPALSVDMKKGALVRVDCDRIGTEPRGVLKWMLTPATA